METKRIRQRAVGYGAAAHINSAIDELQTIVNEARKLINQPNTAEERYLRLGKILDAGHEGIHELREILKRE